MRSSIGNKNIAFVLHYIQIRIGIVAQYFLFKCHYMLSEVEFVHAVSAGGSVKFLPAV